jgi:hypothetical protein
MGAMRRHRILPAALSVLALTAGAVLVASSGSSAEPSKSQELFKKTLLDDDKTTSAIKRLLTDGGGFVAPDTVFADVTGDGRSDALVLVETGGVAGAVALYLFSTDGEAADSPLRAIYRSQRLYRATVEPEGTSLKLRTPKFAQGDDICCPAKIAQRTYDWSASAKTLKLRNSVEFDGPGATATPRSAAVATAARAAAATDATTARRAILRLTDLPGGWNATDPGSARKPSACAGIRQARAAVTARRNSLDFDRSPNQVSHTVYLYANAGRARSSYAKLTSAATRRCVSAETKTKLEAALDTVGAVRTSTVRIARVGAQSRADRFALDYRADGGAITTFTLTLVYVREGRGLSLLALVDETGTFDAKLRARLTSLAGSRLRKLLAA